MLAASFEPFNTTAMDAVCRQQQPDTATQVAEKVMRRIEVAKVARNLQDCLAFASFKAQNGWQNRTISTIETEISEKLARRKRPHHDDLLHSDGSSTFSEDRSTTSNHTITNVTRSYIEPRKRVRATASVDNIHMTWNQDRFVAYPPVLERPQTVPEEHTSTLQDSPMFDAPSTPSHVDDMDMPTMQEPASSVLSSSPPRTPPPTRRSLANTKLAGADLLLHLGNSPQTPVVHIQEISSTVKDTLSTPHYLRSTHTTQTPGNPSLYNSVLHTPGNFNLSEFCNVTPSPAQAQLGRQAMLNSTPTRSTRRNLNFDNLLPPSPTPQRRGLALHLGDEL